MKRLLFFFLAIIATLTCFAAEGPTIQFKERMYDFGSIKEDDKTATCYFVFTNVGNAPLIIHRVIASCGCTTPEYPKAPIVPGDSGRIKVTYNTVGRPYAFHKSITVYSNDPQNPNVILTIKGTVIPSSVDMEQSYPKNMNGLRLDKTQISIQDAKIGSIRTEQINIVNTTSKPIKLSFARVPKHIRINVSNSTLQPNETGSINLTYLAELAKDYGKREDELLVVLNNNLKNSQQNKIYVSAYITEDFSRLSAEQRQNAPVASFSENRFDFGSMRNLERKTNYITLTNNGKSPLFIRKVVSEYVGLTVVPEKMVIAPAKTIKIKLDFKPVDLSGQVVERATVFTNDPKNSIARLFVTAKLTAKN